MKSGHSTGMPNGMGPGSQRRWLTMAEEWAAVGAPILAVAISVGMVTRWYAGLNAVPQIAIPAHPQPQRNGFDVLCRATEATVDPDLIDKAADRKLAQQVTDAQRDRVLRDNASLLAAVDQSLKMTWEPPTCRSFSATFPELKRFRQTARLLRVEGAARTAHGDSAGAAAACLNAMELGADDVAHHGILIRYLVGIACEAIGRRPMWSLIGSLKASDARVAARRVEQIDTNRATLADTFVEEKWSSEASELEEFHKFPVVGFLNIDDHGSDDAPLTAEQQRRWDQDHRSRQIQLLKTGKSGALLHFAKYMDDAAAQLRMPYRVDVPPPVIVDDTVTWYLRPSVGAARMKELDARADNALLCTALALRAYYVDHGAYPEALDGLVTGGYLDHLPIDPFTAARTPVRYRKLAADRYLLYSVGPDGKDDGGRPIDDRDEEGKQKRFVRVGDKGDFVVGANLY